MRPLYRLTIGLFAAVVLAPLAPVAASAAPATPRAKTPAAAPKVGGYVKTVGRVAARKPSGKASEVLPDSVDLRQWAPAIGNQGQIGSCVSWSIAHQIMGYWANRTSGAGAPYAPLYLYMRTVAPGGAPSAGTNPDNALSVAANSGVDTQADYFQGYYNYQTAPTTAQIANAANYRVSGYTRLWLGAGQTTTAKEAMMAALASGNPVAIGMPVYSNFSALGAHTLYSTSSGSLLGGHMMAAFGYDAQGIFVRNSWGTGWGNSGETKLSWSWVLGKIDAAYSVRGITTPANPAAIAPTIASMSVAKGSNLGGTQVTVTGSGLADVTSVTVGGAAATGLSTALVGGSTKLTFTTPAGTNGVVDVLATSPGGTSPASAATKFTYHSPPPTLTSLDTGTGTIFGGTVVTATGAGFLPTAPKVTVGLKAATGVKVLSATSLTFVTPAQVAGSYDVKLTNANGPSATRSYTYTNPPAPQVTAATPSQVPYYKSTVVSLTGQALTGVSLATLGGVKVAYTKVSDTAGKVTIPAGTAGTYGLVLTTPGGTSQSVSLTRVVPAAPVASTLSATSGWNYVANTVTVNGSNFTDATMATSNGVKVTMTRISATQVKVTLPKASAAGTVPVRVVTPGGTSNALTFTYNRPAAPTVSTLSASSAATTASTAVTITGANLTAATLVTVGGVKVSYTRLSDTQIRATFGKRTAGTYHVQVTTPGGSSTTYGATAFRYL
ncbi:hypothetical protein GCM10010124_07280 [Pilimelia terevasa]|uniref:Uncharacterized protein n=1 Tax=Pilimelia terevasa TaxID=53372 RepID=A0A8J3BF33_9ACTN|nr:IPT/TIG domain-containing protein [Pilimelia terevasa]GGK17271.1 hypothetical protein GCM10010124_07280 [Pilimelia terevasa]